MTSSKKLIQASAGNVAGSDFYPYTVDNSIHLEPLNSGNPILSRTIGAGSQTNFTWSFWVKPPVVVPSGYSNTGQLGVSGGAVDTALRMTNNLNGANPNILWPYAYNGGYIGQDRTVSVFRDASAWYHVVWAVDTTNGTEADRSIIYVNGVRQSVTQDYAWTLNGNTGHGTSGNNMYITRYGYMAEVVLLDGTTASPTSFGQDKNGVWVPKNISGLTFGNNGFYLDFSNSAALGTDVSGNGNNFTTSGLTSSDQMADTPTNNFCTWNPLAPQGSSAPTFGEGNLYVNTPITGSGNTWGTFLIPQSGSWYWETTWDTGDFLVVGVSIYDPLAAYFNTIPTALFYHTNGYIYEDTGSTTGYTAASNTDVLGVHVDVDAGEVSFYLNNTLLDTVTYDAAGLLPYVGDASGTPTIGDTESTTNFGQSDFVYTPPTGALALCTANLPEPTIGPNSDTLSAENFNTVLWTGTSLARSITGVGFQPDLLWTKSRSTAESHRLHDAVRGGNGSVLYELNSNEASVEGTDTLVSSLDSDGFSIAAGGNTPNVSGRTYVGWNWKANGSGVSNTDGDITSTVSANQDAGISIITYTGNGTSGATIGHGLNAVPKTIWVKDRGDTNAFTNYFESLGTGSELYFAYTQGVTNSNFWITSPTTSVFSASSSEYVNASAHTYVAYAFAEVDGFSSFGSYTGNGSADGPMIFTGMRPAFVIVKQTNVARGWYIFDSARDTYNAVDDYLRADTDAAEANFDSYDFLSNGFKLRNNNASFNESGGTYIYMAFAENPFKYANAR